MSRLLASVLFSALCAVAACSYCYAVKYRVTVSEDVELEPEAVILMGSAETDDVAAALADAEVVGVNEHRKLEASAEAAAHDELEPAYLFAWVDLDGDGSWSDGEPWGADPNNPVTHGCEEYFAYIEIGAP